MILYRNFLICCQGQKTGGSIIADHITLLLRHRYVVRISARNFWRHTEVPSIIERYFTGIRYVKLEGNRYFGHYLREDKETASFYLFLIYIAEV